MSSNHPINQAPSTTNTNNTDNTDNNVSKSPPPPKKKKPIEHLIAGGIAGFVESSICHPLDTIKTRMQLRRQTTNRKKVQQKVERMEGRALGSMRDATTAKSVGNNNGGGGGNVVSGLDGKGALHRTTVGGNGNSSKAKAANTDKSIKKETVRIKPNVTAATSSTSSSSSGIASSTSSAMHDVGWKQRLPSTAPSPSSASTAAATTSTIIKSSTTSSTTAAGAAATTNSPTVVATLGPFGTARRIIQREGPMALYKGLTAVYTGIVPKMAIRFVSFEYYRDVLGGWYDTFQSSSSGGGSSTSMTTSSIPPQVTFFAGLLSGLTEAILVVTPAEVCKIRMQSQYHSLMDPTQMTHIKYKNVVQTAALVVKEEGLGALYKGVVPTMLRQGCNQAVNFTAYNWSKKRVLAWKRERAAAEEDGGNVVTTESSSEITLDHWQSLLLGGLSGGMGPLVNNPLDVVKTRMQKQVIRPGTEPKYKSLMQSCVVIAREEGTLALWKGITPRLMRIMPGQAITFMTYEAVSKQMDRYGVFD